jgi:WD repeat-containing protein 48
MHAWCTVDTSIGNLMVHIASTQAFDAEIFVDEAGYHGEFKFEEDHLREYFLAYATSRCAHEVKVNIGKWILGNLFAPFVARQKIIQSEPD